MSAESRHLDPLGLLLAFVWWLISDPLPFDTFLAKIPTCRPLHADRGYDAKKVRRTVEALGVMPNIPPSVNRRWKNRPSPFLYRNRSAIERRFGRLKGFRRTATRYNRLASNFPTATVSYWL